METPKKKLARWWNTLQRWDWPVDMPFKPMNFNNLINYDNDNRSNRNTKYHKSMPAIHFIEKLIGLKECLRWHHLNNLHYTNEYFEDWWMENRDFLLHNKE